jgi:hypothetical protein
LQQRHQQPKRRAYPVSLRLSLTKDNARIDGSCKRRLQSFDQSWHLENAETHNRQSGFGIACNVNGSNVIVGLPKSLSSLRIDLIAKMGKTNSL